MCTNKYSNKERYDKIIAKTKWCSFLCLTEYMNATPLAWWGTVGTTDSTWMVLFGVASVRVIESQI